MESQTVESQPFKISLKVAIPFLLSVLVIAYYGIDTHNKDISRITACETKIERMHEEVIALKAKSENNAEDIDIINVQYARIEARLAEIYNAIKNK